MEDKVGVIGRHEDGWGVTHIGRISYEGETKIGKVNLFRAGKANFYFHDRGTERDIGDNYLFEVLYYNDDYVIEPRSLH